MSSFYNTIIYSKKGSHLKNKNWHLSPQKKKWYKKSKELKNSTYGACGVYNVRSKIFQK